MHKAVLRKSGGSLILTVPQAYVEQNRLGAGSELEVAIEGRELTVRPAGIRPRLGDLLNATPRGAGRVRGWDELRTAGREK